MEKKRRLNQYIQYIKRKKEARLAIFYSVFYFVFITLLLFFGTRAGAQTPGIYVKVAEPKSELLMRPMERMMTNIYNLKMTGDFDRDYLAIMNEFQEGGKNLCGIYAKAGDDAKLIENAKVGKVQLKEQQKQLKNLSGTVSTYTIQQRNNDLMETLNTMMSEMKRKSNSGKFDTDYTSVMVLYNWAGSELAKAELHYGLNKELKDQSQDMLDEFSDNENILMNWFNRESTASK